MKNYIENNFFDSILNSIPKTILVFSLIGFAVYFNSLFGEFVWDDLVIKAHTSELNSFTNTLKLFTIGKGGLFYRPFSYGYLSIAYSTFGENVFFYHFTQLSLHITNTILIFYLFKKFFTNKLSFFLSLVFLIHPINTEAVSYITNTIELLAACMGLIAFHLMSKIRLSWLNVSIASFFMLLSFLSKENGFLILLFIVFYKLLFRRNEYLKISLFAIIPTAVYIYLRFILANTYFHLPVHYAPIAAASFTERLITMPKILFFYISTFFAPINLAIAQHWVVRQTSLRDFYIPLLYDILFVAALLCLSLYIYKYHKKNVINYIFFLVWFLCGLGLYMQIFPLDMTVGERWFYIPMIGLLGLIGKVFQNLDIKNQYLKKIVIFGYIIVIVAFSFRTMLRNTNWQTPYSLLSNDIKVNPDSFEIAYMYSIELTNLNKYDEALIYAKTATVLNPKYSPSWATLGNVYLQKKKYKTSIPIFKKALELDGGSYLAFNNMIFAYLLTEDFSSAKGWSEHALKSYLNQPDLLLFLAIAEYKLGNAPKALELVKLSYELKPNTQSQKVYSIILNNKPLKLE